MKTFYEFRDQTSGATPPEKMDDKMSGKAKEFMKLHKVQVPDESNHDAAISKNKEAFKNTVTASPKRPGDNNAGDKNFEKARATFAGKPMLGDE